MAAPFPDPFAYAGGEFEHDAPYVEEEHGAGGSGEATDLNALLVDLMCSGAYTDAADADTCFAINAAGSFAAISNPEEEIGALALKTLTPEALVAVVDILTPVELMQAILFLEACTQRHDDGAIPAAMRATPTFHAASTQANNPSATLFAWFRLNEKLLMQVFALLGISLNHEAIVDGAASSDAASTLSVLYSLLFRGSKVTQQATIDDILSDLFQLLAMPDVLDLDSLTKQLVREMGLFQLDQSTSAVALSADTLDSMRAQFTRAMDGDVATGTSFSITFDDTAAAAASKAHVQITLPAIPQAQLEAEHHCRTSEPGELFARIFARHFEQCQTAVAHAIQQKIGGASAPSADVPIAPASADFQQTDLGRFLRSLTPQSTLASLLSPETHAAEHPADFFAHFIRVAQLGRARDATRSKPAAPAAASLSLA